MRCALAIAFFSAFALADEVNILPDPPADTTALARAEYHKAEQEFAAGNYGAAERALDASWKLQRIPLTQYNLALVYAKQGRLVEASAAMLVYFAMAPPAAQDKNNRAAKLRLQTIAKLRGHESRSGRRYAREAIAKMRAGDYGAAVGEIDRAFAETQDYSLLYWLVLGEYRLTKARYAHKAKQVWRPAADRHMSSIGLDNLKRLLNAYFNGAEDMSDADDARKLWDEIDTEWRRSSGIEMAQQRARGM